MRKEHFTTRPKFCAMALIGAGALLMASCAVDGFDDETFRSDVSGVVLESPNADDITVVSSADGKTQTFTWPVVQGAGGYLVTFYDEANPQEPIVKDSLVDGCSITTTREEDMKYIFSIRTIGNPEKHNGDALEVTTKLVSTFTPTFATIPAGSDLNEWFAANPVPEQALTENLNYDLIGGSDYTLSGELDFDAHKVTLRSTNKANHAKITYTTNEATINFGAAFNAKYLDFDCSGMDNSKGVFGFSKAPSAEKNTEYDFVIIEDPVSILNCNFKNVDGYFIWDNRKGQKIAFMTVLVDNCVVQMYHTKISNGAVIWVNNGGYINDLTVQNSTFYNLSADGDLKYMCQAGGYRCTNIGASTNSVSYKNCTFYRIGWKEGEFGNYNAMKGKSSSYWVMTNCICLNSSTKGGVPRRFLAGSAYPATSECVKFANNTYCQKADDGTVTFDAVGNYDVSGTQIEEDPLFANPDAGDFHISGATQLSLKTGDPRWLP